MPYSQLLNDVLNPHRQREERKFLSALLDELGSRLSHSVAGVGVDSAESVREGKEEGDKGEGRSVISRTMEKEDPGRGREEREGKETNMGAGLFSFLAGGREKGGKEKRRGGRRKSAVGPGRKGKDGRREMEELTLQRRDHFESVSGDDSRVVLGGGEEGCWVGGSVGDVWKESKARRAWSDTTRSEERGKERTCCAAVRS